MNNPGRSTRNPSSDSASAKRRKIRKDREWDEIIARHSAMFALEPRFMFDAAVAATADAIADKTADAQAEAGLGQAADAGDGGVDGADSRPGDAAAGDGDPLLRSFLDNLATSFDGERDGPGFMLMSGSGGGYEPDNEAPTLTGGDAGFNGLEDKTIALAGLSVEDAENDTLTVTVSVEHGTLSFTSNAGIAVTELESAAGGGVRSYLLTGDHVKLSEALATLKYQGDRDWNGTDNLHIEVKELMDLGHDPLTRDIAIQVAPANDDPALSLPDEAPFILEDTRTPINGVQIADPDADDAGSAEVISVRLETTRGTLEFGGGLSVDSVLDADGHHYSYSFSGTRDEVNQMLAGLSYQGEQDYFGSDFLKITFTDKENLAADKWFDKTLEIKVTDENDSPTIGPDPDHPAAWLNADVLEGGETILTREMFNIRDVDNTDEQIRIEILGVPDPAKGVLMQKMGGAWVKIVSGSLFSLQDVIKENIKYVATGAQVREDAAGSAFAGSTADSFTFRVNDGAGGTVVKDGGETISFDINLKPVNQDPEVVIGGSGSRTELDSYDPITQTSTLRLVVYEGEDRAVLKFGIIDPDQAAGAPHQVRITSLPVDGVLFLDGVAVTLNQTISMADIAAGKLTYTHSGVDGSDVGQPRGGTRPDGFTVEVMDDGGGAGTARTVVETIDIAVRPNNDLPEFNHELGAGDVAGQRDVTGFNTNFDLGPAAGKGGLDVTDVDSLSTAITYTITDATDHGSLYYFDGAGYRLLVKNDSFTQADILAGRIVYRYNGGLNTDPEAPTVHAGVDTLKVTVRDGSLTAWGRDDNGVPHENDPKFEGGVGTWVDGKWVLTEVSILFNVNFTATGSGTTPPLVIIGEKVIAPGGDLNAEVHEGGRTTITSDDLTALVKYDKTDTNNVVTKVEETDPTLRYRVETDARYGQLYKREYLTDSSGKAILDAQDKVQFTGKLIQLDLFSTFTQADIDAGAIYYEHDGNENFSDHFEVSLSDGVKETPKVRVDLHVKPVNDTPEVHGDPYKPILVLEGPEAGQENEAGFAPMGVVLTPDRILIGDVDGSGGRAETGYQNQFDQANSLTFVIYGKPVYGDIWVYKGSGDKLDIANWNKVQYATDLDAARDVTLWTDSATLGATILTRQQLADGDIRYIHDGSENFEDAIGIIANDNQGIAYGGEVRDGAAHGSSISRIGSIRVLVTPVNDAPQRETNLPLQATESAVANPTNYADPGVGTVLDKNSLAYGDNDNSATQLQYRIVEETKNGTLYRKVEEGGVYVWKAMGKGGVFTQDDLDKGYVKYVHNGSETHRDGFVYTLSDGDITKEYLNREQTFSIEIAPANNAPELTVKESAAGPKDGHLYLDIVDGKSLAGVFQIDDRDYHDTRNPGYGIERDQITVVISASVKESGALWGRLGFDSSYTKPDGLAIDNRDTAQITLTGTLADINAALAHLFYKPDPASPDLNKEVAIQVHVDDLANGDATLDQANKKTADGSVSLFVSTLNEEPTQEPGERPGQDGLFVLRMNEDAKNVAVKHTNGEYLKFTDPDAFYRNVNSLTLEVKHGTLNFSSTSGLASLKVTGNNSGKLVVTGTVDDINAVLKNLQYTPDADWNGADAMSISYADGNSSEWGTGASSKLLYESSMNIRVDPVNDAPTLELPTAPVAVDAGDNYRLINADGAIRVDDAKDFARPAHDDRSYGTGGIDGGMWDYDKTSGTFRNDEIQVTISAVKSGTGTAHGKLTIDAGNRSPSLVVSGDQTDNITIKGTREQVNLALAGLLYNAGDPEQNVQVDIKIHVDDLGNGSPTPGDNKYADGKILLLISSTNSPPEITRPETAVLDEDASFQFTGSNAISVRDPDALEFRIRITLSVEHGGLGLNESAFLKGDTVQKVTAIVDGKEVIRGYTITASQSRINSALATLKYTADPDFNGADRLDITVDDLNNFSANPASAALTDAKHVVITVNPVNDAPLVVDKGTAVDMDEILEDVRDGTADNPGQKIADLFDSRFNDNKDAQRVPLDNPDGSIANSLAGVVVVKNTANATTQGKWEYYDAGSSAWVDIGSRAGSNGLFLTAETIIRFQPAGDYNGKPPSLEVRLVDSSAGDAAHGNPALPNQGGTVDLSAAASVGGTTRYSADVAILSISVKAVNDAPTVAYPNTPVTRNINEDPATNDGETVTSLFGDKFGDAADNKFNASTNPAGSKSNTLHGVAVTGNGADAAGEGRWQYLDGSTWVDIGARSEATALFLAAGTKIRFQPAGDYHGTPPSLEVRLVDNSAADPDNGNPGLPINKDVVDLTDTGTGGNTRYSAAHAVLTMTVNPVNDAPVISDPSMPVTMNPIAEDVSAAGAANPGQKVSDLFAGRFDDSKESTLVSGSDNALAGIVVVGNPASAKGAWQYWNGSSWANIPTGINNTNGVFIAADSAIRFQPATDYNGEPPHLAVRVVDDSSASPANGATVNVSSNGGTTPYSAQTVKVVIRVEAVNDAPVVNPPGTPVPMTAVDEDVASDANAGASIGSLFGGQFNDDKDAQRVPVANPDGSIANDLAGVVIVGNGADPATQGSWQYFDADSNQWVDIGARSDANGLFLDTGTKVRFQPAPDYNGTPPSLSVRLADTSTDASNPGLPANGDEVNLAGAASHGGTTRYSDGIATLSIVVNPSNDAPAVIGGAGQTVDMTAIPEDPTAAQNPGQTVSDLFDSKFSDPVDATKGSHVNHLAGIVVVGNGADALKQGTWEYSADGVNWTTIGTGVSDQNGLYLAKDTLVRFNPKADYNGEPPALAVRLADDFPDASNPVPANASTVDVRTNGGNTRYSVDTIDLAIAVHEVNDSPTRDGDEVINLDAVSLDTAGQSPGTTVRDLFGLKFTDARDRQYDATGNPAGSVEDNFAGVVVTATVDPQYGHWQYSTDGGATWTNIVLSGNDNLVLAPDARVRFLPDADTAMSGQAVPDHLVVRLIEDSSGAVATGDTLTDAQLGANPDTGPYSNAANQIKVAISVIGNNTAPDITGIDAINAIEQIPILLAPGGNLSDLQLDSNSVVGNWGGATLTIRRQGGADARDVFGARAGGPLSDLANGGSLVLNGEVIGSVSNAGGVLVLTFNANADPTKMDAVLRNLTYTIDDDAPPSQVILEYTVNDGNAPNGAQGLGPALEKTITQTVTIAAVPDDPIAVDDAGSLSLDQTGNGAITGNILANDRNPDKTTLKVEGHAALNGPYQYGRLSVDEQGNYTYTVDSSNSAVKNLKPGSTLTETITYEIVNADGRTDSAVLTIVIRNENFPPATDPGDSRHVEDGPRDDGGQRGLKDLEVTKPVVENVNRANQASDQRIADNIRTFQNLASSWSLSRALDDAAEWSPDITLAAKLEARDLFVDMRQEYNLPGNLFVHSDPAEKLTLTAMLADGSPLPDWMQFDPETTCLTCHAPADQEGALDVMILAEDSKGKRARAILNLKLVKDKADDSVPLEPDAVQPAEPDGESDPAEEGDKNAGNDLAGVAAGDAEDLALVQGLLFPDGKESGDLPDGVHPGLRSQIAATGSTAMLAEARTLARELVEAP